MSTPSSQPIAFCLVRIDDRLLHGQVVLNWISVLQPRCVAIVDDEAARDSAVSGLYALALPASVPLKITSLAEARCALLGDTSHPPERTLVLLRSPAVAVALYDLDVHYTALNLGCLGSAPGRVRVRRQLCLSREEVTLLHGLSARGVRVIAQAVPAESSLSMEEIACRVLHTHTA